MTNGEKIEYAIRKEVSSFSFIEWLNNWDIGEVDFDKFMEAGKEAVDKEEKENE